MTRKKSTKDDDSSTAKGEFKDSNSTKQPATTSNATTSNARVPSKSTVIPKNLKTEKNSGGESRCEPPKHKVERIKDDVDEIFEGRSKKAKKTETPVEHEKKSTKVDKDEIAKEAARYKGSSSTGGRQYVDGLPVYSLEELQEEMGDSAWDAFMDAAEPGH